MPHFIGLRVGDEHVAHLDALAKASGFMRGEILRRLLLSTEIPSARTRQDVQDLVKIQRAQNRLGGLLKKALTEREQKASLRQTVPPQNSVDRTIVDVSPPGVNLPPCFRCCTPFSQPPDPASGRSANSLSKTSLCDSS